jgi:uncharacterized DUF497 family protein
LIAARPLTRAFEAFRAGTGRDDGRGSDRLVAPSPLDSRRLRTYTPTVDFEWDPEKAQRNEARHGVSFKEAATVFGDPLSLDFDDPDHSAEELRGLIVGQSEQGRLLIVAYTERGRKMRIISAREVTRGEREQYENG